MRSFLIIAIAIATVGGGTYSYFSAKKSASGTLSTGTLAIDILEQNTSNPLTFNVPGLVPGETAFVNFDVKNNSDELAVNLRGAAYGEWATPDDMTSPNNALVQVVKVERWNGVWETLAGDGVNPITGYFYYSPDGSDSAHFSVPAGGMAQFRLTVKLDEDAGDQYQDEVYNAAVKVQARQVGATTWPTDLESGF